MWVQLKYQNYTKVVSITLTRAWIKSITYSQSIIYPNSAELSQPDLSIWKSWASLIKKDHPIKYSKIVGRSKRRDQIIEK